MKLSYYIAALVFFIGLQYRFAGIEVNHPFWIDEFSSAHQARLILEKGISVFWDRMYNIESYNLTTYSLVALGFKVLGISESAARIPFVIIGSLVPVSVFLLGKQIMNAHLGLSAMILTAFSYIQITWSRQARGYILLQLLIVLSIILYLRILQGKNDAKNLILFIIVSCIGILTHAFFYLFFIAIVIHVAFFYSHKAKTLLLDKRIIGGMVLVGAIALFSGLLNNIVTAARLTLLSLHNNSWYYHSFLWREYGLITFLAVTGVVMMVLRNRKDLLILPIYMALHLIFINFFYDHYISKYTLPIFPLLLLFTAYSINYLSKLVIKNAAIEHSFYKNHLTKISSIVPIFITLLIIFNGHKFVFKPKQFYSVNHDFREIALIDYKQIYSFIETQGQLVNGDTAVIDTWFDRPPWYLGMRYPHYYIFRWEDGGNSQKRTTYIVKDGEKVIPTSGNVKYMSNLTDFKRIMNKYRYGFILIDDSTLPEDVLQYAKNNLKKELYIDHYPFDDNPYSIWPATLYSWGIK